MKSDRTQRGPKGFILLEPGNIMQILPEDNKSWLTLFYSLPEELVSKRPAYMNLPRCPFDVIRSDDYAELLNTDVFLELVWDCYAWSAWQCFEVPNKDGDYRSPAASIPIPEIFHYGDCPIRLFLILGKSLSISDFPSSLFSICQEAWKFPS